MSGNFKVAMLCDGVTRYAFFTFRVYAPKLR